MKPKYKIGDYLIGDYKKINFWGFIVANIISTQNGDIYYETKCGYEVLQEDCAPPEVASEYERYWQDLARSGAFY